RAKRPVALPQAKLRVTIRKVDGQPIRLQQGAEKTGRTLKLGGSGGHSVTAEARVEDKGQKASAQAVIPYLRWHRQAISATAGSGRRLCRSRWPGCSVGRPTS